MATLPTIYALDTMMQLATLLATLPTIYALDPMTEMATVLAPAYLISLP
jgi:hypothetical protein